MEETNLILGDLATESRITYKQARVRWLAASALHYIVQLEDDAAIEALESLRDEISAALRPDTLTITIHPRKKEHDLNPIALAPNTAYLVTVTETSSKTGKVFPVTAANDVSFSIDNGSVATIKPNGDGTATLTTGDNATGAVETANVSVNDPSTGLSGSVQITISEDVVVTPPDAPDTLAISITPVATAPAAAVVSASGAKPV